MCPRFLHSTVIRKVLLKPIDTCAFWCLTQAAKSRPVAILLFRRWGASGRLPRRPRVQWKRETTAMKQSEWYLQQLTTAMDNDPFSSICLWNMVIFRSSLKLSDELLLSFHLWDTMGFNPQKWRPQAASHHCVTGRVQNLQLLFCVGFAKGLKNRVGSGEHGTKLAYACAEKGLCEICFGLGIPSILGVWAGPVGSTHSGECIQWFLGYFQPDLA